MPDYSGKFQYCDGNGAALAQGPCRISFDEDSFIATPASGAAIAFDLGDVDVFAHGEWELQLSLYTGRQLVLRQFGAAFDRMTAELGAAWRDRNLLLPRIRNVRRGSHPRLGAREFSPRAGVPSCRVARTATAFSQIRDWREEAPRTARVARRIRRPRHSTHRSKSGRRN